jgi:diphthine-ammonia ligase
VRKEPHEEKDLHVQSRSYWAPANIGPYSQARSEFIYQDTATTRFVHIAGQIPLVPSTMALAGAEKGPSTNADMTSDLVDPYLKSKSYHLTSFIKQSVLSLQHLWRIGQAMDICWWTGAVVYLSKDTSSNIVQKAILVAEAWIEAHGGRFQELPQRSPLESGISDEDERDPWDERYHKAFVHIEAAKEHVKKLPDWSAVSTRYLHVGKDVHSRELPPIFIAEVAELPRSSDIEWHAFLGVTRGPIVVIIIEKRHAKTPTDIFHPGNDKPNPRNGQCLQVCYREQVLSNLCFYLLQRKCSGPRQVNR